MCKVFDFIPENARQVGKEIASMNLYVCSHLAHLYHPKNYVEWILMMMKWRIKRMKSIHSFEGVGLKNMDGKCWYPWKYLSMFKPITWLCTKGM